MLTTIMPLSLGPHRLEQLDQLLLAGDLLSLELDARQAVVPARLGRVLRVLPTWTADELRVASGIDVHLDDPCRLPDRRIPVEHNVHRRDVGALGDHVHHPQGAFRAPGKPVQTIASFRGRVHFVVNLLGRWKVRYDVLRDRRKQPDRGVRHVRRRVLHQHLLLRFLSHEFRSPNRRRQMPDRAHDPVQSPRHLSAGRVGAGARPLRGEQSAAQGVPERLVLLDKLRGLGMQEFPVTLRNDLLQLL